jgi:ATP-dependent DNA helicase RecG
MTMRPEDARKLMQRAIRIMRGSVAEPRSDGKVSPRVGAVVRFPDGRVETACRGELRHGEHAEYTLLDRKCVDRKLDGAALFATLEPCAPGSRGHPKLACAERIVAARIRDVWVGIEDPDPTVDRKGIRHLEENGVAVHLFDRDLQEQIRSANKRFLHQALARAQTVRKGAAGPRPLSAFEAPAPNVTMDDLRQSALERYRGRLHSRGGPKSAEFLRALDRQGLVAVKGQGHVPTGFGLLLFGDQPRDTYPQAGVIGTIRYPDGAEESRDFDGPLVETPTQVEEWFRRRFPSTIDRSHMVRGERAALPFELLRESVVNALVHRDYDIAGAKVQLLVTPETITVRSPGGPVAPVTLEQLQTLDAPTLSRNPKIHFVFRRMGLAEEAGLGMATMRTFPAKHGLPAPQYSFDAPYLVLTIYRSAESAARGLGGAAVDALNPDERRGWLFLATRRGATMAQYARHMGFDARKAQRHLRRFVELNLLRRTGAARATRYEVVRP